MLLNDTYGFGEATAAKPNPLEAPQASAMAAVIQPLMTGDPAPWLLYLGGCFMALVLEWVGVPPLAFALGMYLPLHLNTPILAGGLVSYFVTKGGSDETKRARKEKGTLMASGFVAGGAIMGVVAALVLFFGKMLVPQDWTRTLDNGTVVNADGWSVVHALNMHHWVEENPWSAVLALVLFFGVCFYLYKGARNAASD
jgi:uncharacterized oligopeptide transporter (OPT) family protein